MSLILLILCWTCNCNSVIKQPSSASSKEMSVPFGQQRFLLIFASPYQTKSQYLCTERSCICPQCVSPPKLPEGFGWNLVLYVNIGCFVENFVSFHSSISILYARSKMKFIIMYKGSSYNI
jgi:hypothetical protein